MQQHVLPIVVRVHPIVPRAGVCLQEAALAASTCSAWSDTALDGLLAVVDHTELRAGVWNAWVRFVLGNI